MGSLNLPILNQLDEEYCFTKLAQPFAGLVGLPAATRPNDISQPSLVVASSSVADISTLLPELRTGNGGRFVESNLAGGCADEDYSTAMMKAVAEAAERYAMVVIRPDEYITSTANDLGKDAIDWTLFPQCTKEEYTHAQCPVVPFNPDSKIRWIKGLSMITGKSKYVPLSLTHISSSVRRAESFSLPISTGVAVHTDIYEAISRAILEVVERDSISLTWLLSLQLPHIKFDSAIPEQYSARFASFDKSNVKQYLFDATTDLGIPVVYGVMNCKGHPRVVNVVTAASDLEPYSACAKAMREAVSTRLAIDAYPYTPDSIQECFKLEHGAKFMGTPEHSGKFDFLINNSNSRNISQMSVGKFPSTKSKVEWLVSKLKAKKIEVIVSELTPDEFKDSGLRAVRVVIPQLMPLSYHCRARFLQHPRLNDYAQFIGINNFNAEDINPFPQPFA